ncbi:MAG TPA: DUF5994 family protein [Mycobacteriales bacterium]|jgi:hypothetical protein|nr:DUF5994 family protein [Mycobacteriales bacterium]
MIAISWKTPNCLARVRSRYRAYLERWLSVLALWDIQKKRHEYDGIWWPRSRDLAAEVPALNAHPRD